ncbi:MAG: hypothetical protein QNL04_00050 [SAR324 cluster bacterium]|nr:hypothetical protein [SAR324 cluster bacterium]
MFNAKKIELSLIDNLESDLGPISSGPNGLGLSLLIKLDAKGKPDLKSLGYGTLRDITDETKKIYEFPFKIQSSGGDKWTADFGAACADDSLPLEEMALPRGEKYSSLILPITVALGAIIKTEYEEKESFSYKVTSIVDF